MARAGSQLPLPTHRFARADAAVCALLFVAGAGLCTWVLLRLRGGLPLLDDEVAYLFQARTFADGHLSVPSPPLPEFFEAAHLLVVPRMMAKYFPGHALVLAPFVALGVRWAAPALLLGGSTALVYLAARASGLGMLAALAGAVAFLGSGDNLAAAATFLSQPTGTFCAAAGLAAAALLRSRGQARWAAAFGAAAGLALLTRPFDGLALAAAAVAMPRSWTPRGAAAAGGVFLLCGLALLGFCKATTGAWTLTPWALYARQYMPYDGPGVGPAPQTAPERTFPPHLRSMDESFRVSRAHYTASVLPHAAAVRARVLLDYLPGAGAGALLVIGLSSGLLAVPLTYAALLFLLQLGFHSQHPWYAQELWPALALGVAAGAGRLVQLTLSVRARLPRLLLASATGVALVLLAAGCALELRELAPLGANLLPPLRAAQRALEPARKAAGLVFVRYPPGSPEFFPLSNLDPDLQRAAPLLVLDLGARNPELRRQFPARPAFLYDVGAGTLQQLP